MTKTAVALRPHSRERRRGITAHNSISYSVYRRFITGWFLRRSVNPQYIYLLLHCRVDCKLGRKIKKNLLGWSGVKFTITAAFYWPIFPDLDDMIIVEHLVEWMSGRRNWSTGRKPDPNVAISTTNPTWLERDSNSSSYSGKSTTNWTSAQPGAICELILLTIHYNTTKYKADILI
jgi:hypothetical protein